jgi:outer membrane protein TolC
VLRAKAFVAVADQSLANARERERISDVQLRAGTGTRFDVLRAQTEVANAQQALIAARNRVNLATAALANAMNVDQNTPLDVTEARENPEQTDNYNTAIAEAYRTRPEILQAEANTEAARKGIILAQRSLFPTVGVGANYNVTPDAGGFAPKTRSWAAVATISVPIFEGGTARARERQARADVQSAETNKQIVQDNVALGVRQAYLGLLEAQERVDVANAALTQAQEQYRLAQVRFREGVTAIPGGSPLLEVSDAQQALTQAQTNQVNARYDLENARARLDAAIGRYAFGGISPGYQSPAAVPENIRR